MKLIPRAALLVTGVLLLAAGVRAQSVTTYVNPVIPGDHPDPTLTKIGDDFYTSGSSFNVTPRIYHSTDLVHWEVISQPVSASWPLYGDAPGGGIWGGHMVHHDGLYWHFFGRGTGDRAMYYVTSNRPEGPWSTPFRMNVPPEVPGFGVDNSIFIDDDNRWFLLTKNGESNNFIVELGPSGQPEGEVYDLTWLNPEEEGLPYGWAEGPVMWKHDGYYYYSFAQHLQGTQYVMRSDTLSDDPSDWDEPRELFETVGDRNTRAYRSPNHSSPAVTLDDGTSWIISQAYNHGGSAEEWKAQGRQGVLSEVVYEDGWPVARFPSDGAVDAPDLPGNGAGWTVPRSDMFDGRRLDRSWSLLGFTPEDSYTLTERPGWLRLYPYGGSAFPPATGENAVVQNDAEHSYTLITRVDFAPASATDEAGLWIFNGLETLHAKLHVALDAFGDRVVRFSFDGTEYTGALEAESPVWLKLERTGHRLAGYHGIDGIDWTAVGEPIDVAEMDGPQPDFNAFTGNQQGLYVHGSTPADYDLFIYRDAYSPIAARYPSNFSGVQRSSAASAGTPYLSGIHDGDWAMYAGVEFGGDGDAQDDQDYARIPIRVHITASSATEGGVVSVWVDAPQTGFKLAEIPISNTGDWDDFVVHSADVPPVTGRKDVYLTFAGAPLDQLFRIERFEFEAQTVNTAVEDPPAPKRPLLRQNYPNPVGSSVTMIEYAVQTPGHVSLSVFNLLGQKIASLIDGPQARGSYTFRFDASDLSNGTYLYRLETVDASVVKIMTVVK